ncbi:MAG: 3-deoxy-D-manno-octulosonic acid transferase [Deltaproteobacteria bacterium]|nr:3-deoxy-D-manno-octulosonic acid transferase [Deltaproteobacteria bacterium]
MPCQQPKRKSIWIHALSVGEVISALPVYRAIKESHPSRDILFSVKTAQGIKIAGENLGDNKESLIPMPLDFWWSIRRITRYIDPEIFILVESDIWPGLIHCLKKRGCKIFLINGRISPRTYNAYKRYRFLSKKLLSALDICLMQSDLDRKRLTDIGVPAEKVITSGNIKFDMPWKTIRNKDRMRWLQILNFRQEARIWVAGSCHPGEYEIIIDVYKRLLSSFPELYLILAPRNPETAGEISRLCRIKGIKSSQRSDQKRAKGDAKFLILDSIGELGVIYGLAEISFVGGSLVPLGGHNLIEPASFGRPVLFGPHTYNFVQMAEMLIEAGGGIRVRDGESLYNMMKGLLKDKNRSDRIGRMALKFANTNKGALNRVLEYIESHI